MNSVMLIRSLWRRRSWVLAHVTVRKLWNLALGALSFARKSDELRSWPAIVKIDVTAACNLSCTICLHADANGHPALQKLGMQKKHMSVENYRRIIEEIRGRSTAVSLYVWGDPLMHPQLPEMIRIAADAGLQTHISTNYSYKLSDERIRELLDSGLSHLTVCVDGVSQEKYERTRVGGQIDRVLDNLERTMAYRRERGRRYPLVEVQFIKFQHNVDELERARTLCEAMGVDKFASFWGALHNYTDWDPGTFEVLAPREAKSIPRCYWPYFSMVIKYDGSVIPCCEYRRGPQYQKGGDARVLGNVFETSVAEVWNSDHYRVARQLATNPKAMQGHPYADKHFCHGCPVLYQTNAESFKRIADEYTWEELYTLDHRGRPVRRPGTRGPSDPAIPEEIPLAARTALPQPGLSSALPQPAR